MIYHCIRNTILAGDYCVRVSAFHIILILELEIIGRYMIEFIFAKQYCNCIPTRYYKIIGDVLISGN